MEQNWVNRSCCLILVDELPGVPDETNRQQLPGYHTIWSGSFWNPFWAVTSCSSFIVQHCCLIFGWRLSIKHAFGRFLMLSLRQMALYSVVTNVPETRQHGISGRQPGALYVPYFWLKIVLFDFIIGCHSRYTMFNGSSGVAFAVGWQQCTGYAVLTALLEMTLWLEEIHWVTALITGIFYQKWLHVLA